MPQLHFSVDEATSDRLRERAKRQGKTLSKYLSDFVDEQLPEQWPHGYLDDVIGCCAVSPIEEPEDLVLDDVCL